MKTYIKILAAAGLMLTSGAVLTAQNTNSGYFLDGYNYRYQMNPSFGNDMNFVSIPGIGNINFAMRGNLNLKDVIFNENGKTVLFTNPNVPNSFLNDLHKNNKLTSDIKLNILSGGFKAWGGYNTVSINARAAFQAGLPKSLFQLAKEGVTNATYDLSGIGANARGYVELGFNHSRDIKEVPGLRVGAAVKFNLGIADFQAKTKKAELALGENEWTATTDATINSNIGGVRFKTKYNDDGTPYVSGLESGDGSIGVNGFGMSFDLGANYQWKDFNFSLALIDLGWISYSKTMQASTNGERTFTTDAFTFNANDEADNSFSYEWKNMRDDLEKLYQLTDNGNVGSRAVSTGPGLNIGIDYALPMYRRLHFGILSSTRFIPDYTWTEVRISANVNPVDCFSATANFAAGTYGCAFGWLLNFNHRYFNIFLGMDNTFGKLAKQGIPLNSNASVNFGINIPF